MAKRRAITGLRGIALMPVVENTIASYEASGTLLNLPFAGQCNFTPMEQTQSIFYDDGLYAQAHEVQGMEVEIRLGEVEQKTLADMGLGTHDPATNRFEYDFTPKQITYSLRMITDTVSGFPFYWNYRIFDLTGWRYDNFATKGDSISVCEAIISGVIKRPMKPTVRPIANLALLEDESNQSDAESLIQDSETL